MEAPANRSTTEVIKENSRHLRGTVVEELKLDTPNFSKETVQVLKFHGMYQQTDRDLRKAGDRSAFSSMVRVGIPGGVLTPQQYLMLDRLAGEIGDGSLRVTTRQDIQFHHIRKTDLKQLIRTLNENLLTTLAACGDVVRNVTCCPAPVDSDRREEVHAYARSISRRLKPKTKAYYEIWLDGEKSIAAQSSEEDSAEPLYGATYLPRKFKIGFAAPGDNCIDVYANDAGVVPVFSARGLEKFIVLAGGSLGMSPGVRATHPRLADPICSVEPNELEETLEAIITIHRDFGNRSNRKFARLKYVIEEIGLEAFRDELERRVGRKLDPPPALEWERGHDHLGWHKQRDGVSFLGVRVLSGRIHDRDGVTVRAALRELVERFQLGVRFTTHQNVLLTDIPDEIRGEVEQTLRRHGVRLAEQLPPVLRQALACPALPTCGLAITEAERIMPDVAADLQRELDEAGLSKLDVSVRMTGCPNGCARPYTAEIGIVGQSVNLYVIYVGGSPVCTRLAFVLAENVRREEIGPRLRPVLQFYREAALPGEAFGDFCHRVGVEALRSAPEAVVQ